MAPTATLPLLHDLLLARQNPPAATVTVYSDPPSPGTTIVATDSTSSSSKKSGPDTGAIVGIVIGTIVGILLIWWIVKSLAGDNKTAAKAPDGDRQGWYDDRAGAVHGRTSSRGPSQHRRSRSGDHHRAHRHHSRHRSSTPRPVMVVDDKQLYGEPRRPSGTYVVPRGEVRRSTSRGQGRSRSPGYYASY